MGQSYHSVVWDLENMHWGGYGAVEAEDAVEAEAGLKGSIEKGDKGM